MTTKDFFCNCIRLYDGCSNYIDRVCNEFGVELTEDDVHEALLYDTKNVGNSLIQIVFDKIIDKAAFQHGISDDDKWALFGYDCQDYCSNLYFNGTVIRTQNDLDEAIEEYLKDNNRAA